MRTPGRGDGENYNIGFVDAADRPCPELAEAAKATHGRLRDAHSGKAAPFGDRPQAPSAGTPPPWDEQSGEPGRRASGDRSRRSE